MRILVTGATGFLGSSFSRRALDAGHQIGGMMLPSESTPPSLAGASGLTWFRGTLAEPPWPEIERFQPEACVHLAWVATPGVYLESPENRDYYLWSLEFIRRIKILGVRHIVGIGTCIEYQNSNQPLSETSSPIAPATTYARYKNELRLALEAEAATHSHDSAFCWGRVFYPYGVGEHPARLCSAIIQKIGRGEPLVLKTPASTKDYIYITDLAEALILLVERRVTGTINLGTGQGVAIRDLARLLGELLERPELIQEADPPEVDPLGYVVADASRLHSMGWRPRYDLRSGLKRLIQSVRPDLARAS